MIIKRERFTSPFLLYRLVCFAFYCESYTNIVRELWLQMCGINAGNKR